MFYLTIIKEDSQAINKYEDFETAMTNFHSEMSYAWNAKIKTCCYITNEIGAFLRRPDYYVPPTTEDAEQVMQSVGVFYESLGNHCGLL